MSRTRGPGPARRRSPARDRLRRLQLRLTAAYTLITLAGLSCLAWLVIRTDDRSREAAEYDEMRRRASVAASLVYYEDDRIRLDGLADDEATAGTPRILVLEDRPGGGPAVVFRGGVQQFDVPATALARAARAAMRGEKTVRQEARDRTGGPVRLLAVPFWHDATDEVAGAAVAVGDPAYGAAEHRSLVLSPALGRAALTALAALTAHVLSGRSMRPAWRALEQRERLLADAAHELRTPVAVMRGSVELAERGSGGADAYLPGIRRAADRMGHVVENLLTRGRLEAAVEAVRAEPPRLDQLVEEVCAELGAGAAAGADRALPFTGRRYGHRALPGAPGGPRPPGRPDRPRPARWRCGVRAAARTPARSPRRAGAGRADRPAGRRVTLTIRS
ncbi:sensor histidine kinase [Streptomyces bacillaris]|uniref:sensor histidine kinase n=1 Tax=Streptomyces bacillaris TaxID=68179 RepID=UPI003F4CD088